MGRLSNIWRIFYKPSAVAASVDERPAWLVPVIVILVLGFVAVYATYEYNVAYQKQLFEEAQRDRGTSVDPESLFKVTPARRIYGGAIGGVSMVLGVLIGGAILHGLALVVGGKSSFRKVFCYYAYAWIIPAAGALAKLPLVIAKKSIDVRSSLAALTPGVRFDSPLGIVLNSADLFYIWMLVVTVVGYSILTGLGTKKSTAIVIGLYILFVAFSVGMTLMRSKVTG